jgi:Ureidoglycolate hydrolase
MFVCEWKGDILYGSNEAVGGHYILGFGSEPEQACENHSNAPKKLLLWHANYHPDGGQLFFPHIPKPFLVPLALPGDDVRPENFICFHFSGNEGLYIHPNVWHEGAITLLDKQSFFDKQGAVHARVSVDFPKEFKCLLEIPLERFNK